MIAVDFLYSKEFFLNGEWRQNMRIFDTIRYDDGHIFNDILSLSIEKLKEMLLGKYEKFIYFCINKKEK